MSDLPSRSTFGSSIAYKDPMAALRWLEKAFGFETALLVTNPDGSLGHSEMTFGSGYIMVGTEWAENVRSPRSVGGANTQFLHVQLEKDIDAHCARARAAGATIVQEPSDQFYGDRTYRALDLEGHMWTFGQPVRQVSIEDMEAASGLKIRTGL